MQYFNEGAKILKSLTTFSQNTVLSLHKSTFIPSQTRLNCYFVIYWLLAYYPPPRKIFPSAFTKNFSCEGSHFGCEGIKFCAANGKIPESLRSEKIFRSFRISGCSSHEHHEIDRHISDLPIAIHPPFIGDDRSITFYTFQINFTVKNYTFQYNFQLKKYTFQIKWHYLLQ